MEEKVWYLITLAKNGKTEIVHDFRNAEKLTYYGGKCTSIGIPHKTKQDLILHEKILKDPCKKCGGLISARNYDSKKVIEKNICSHCNFWDEKIIKSKTDKKVIICNGTYYTIGPETNDRNKFRGHCGRLFVFKRLDTDEIIKSTNVWCGGNIPDHYLEDLKDNAILL